jgi:hypothetical protein
MSAAAIPAHAQWQRNFGVTATDEMGSAVAQTSDGGFIVAGQANDNGSTHNSYVAKTDASGATIWDRTYYFGASINGSFSDVKVCANGDYILTGSTAPPFSTYGSLLAMRIDPNGNIIWTRLIGDNSLAYIGSSVIETRFGNGTTTNAGDIVIGGMVRDLVNNTIEALLLRLTADGDIIWKKRYNGGEGYSDARIWSVIETQLTNPGDIAASGEAFSRTTDLDAMVLRVDGSTGTIGASPQGLGLFDAGRAEYAFSITERQNGAFSGDLVTAGASTAIPALGNYALLMLETRPDPSDVAGLRGSNMIGDYYTSGYQGTCVREITDPALGTPGDVVVGGMAYSALFTTPIRGFLQQFSAGTMAQTGAFHIYGAGSGRSFGTGITECTSALGAPGFAMTGELNAHSPVSSDYDLWLLRTDASMLACNHDILPVASLPPTMTLHRPALTPTTPDFQILCGVQNLATDWGNDICTGGAPPPEKAPAPSEESPEDAISRLELYPNLLHQGESFTLARASEEASGELVVSDIAGREVHRRKIGKGSGPLTMTVGTAGWTPGAYLISLTLNGIVSTGRVTIMAR